MPDLFKPITPKITELKTGTPVIKHGDKYIVAGIGGDFIPNGVIEKPGTGSVVLGQLTEDGKFQPLEFDGTIAVAKGEAEYVSDIYKWDSTYGDPADAIIKFIDSLQESSTYCRCSGVRISEGESFYTVSGAGSSSVDGRYIFLRDTDAGKLYHRSGMDYTGMLVTPQGEKTIFYSSDGLDVEHATTRQLYHCSKDGVWSAVGNGKSPVPTVLEQELNPGDIACWSGNPVDWDSSDKVYKISETTYTTLSCGEYFTPEVGKIYNLEASAVAGKFWGIEGTGAGSTDSCAFYKCAAVHGPRKVTYVNVSGAGTTAVNGDYEKTDLKSDTGGEVWKHQTADYYYYEYDGYWCIHTDYNTWGESALYYSWDGTDWHPGYDYGTEPVPTVSKSTVTVDADAPNTWDGYKAVLADGVYTFEENITTGLTYGEWLTPVTGRVYNDNVTIVVSNLCTGVDPALVFRATLARQSVAADTGQSLIPVGNVQYTNYENRACAYFDGSSYVKIESMENIPIKTQTHTICGWFCFSEHRPYSGLFGFGREFAIRSVESDKCDVVYYTSTGGAFSYRIETSVWYHIAVVWDGSIARLYLNGVEHATQTEPPSFDLEAYPYMTIGSVPRTGSARGYVSDMRIYNRALNSDEVASLAQ